jgi:hypothetical protein
MNLQYCICNEPSLIGLIPVTFIPSHCKDSCEIMQDNEMMYQYNTEVCENKCVREREGFIYLLYVY